MNREKIEQIIGYRQEKPHETLQGIADYFKVSKPYIHKVLKNNNIPTVGAKTKTVKYCLVCGEVTPRKRKLCPGRCSYTYYNIKVNCAFCRIPFYRKRGQIKQKYNSGQYKNIYCSWKCYCRGQRDKRS
jgi:hypothetical protein